MSTLLNAMRTNDSFTENGMTTNSTTLSGCVDLFYQIGAMRGADKQRLINVFVKAFSEDALMAMKLLFWSRDIRGGAGERKIFRDIVTYLANTKTDILRKNLVLFSEYGRWDDILVLFGTPLEQDALELIGNALNNKDGLCAKWMPRPNVKVPAKKEIANTIRKFMGLTPKQYRKVLVEASNTVEQLMCSGKWNEIDYSKLPSKAMSDLMKAFSKNDLARFQEYLGKLEKGEVKINASAVYPYDIIKSMSQGNDRGANAQWLALPNYMEGSNEFVLPLVDVSSSMNQSAGGSQTTCMDVAISLGLYISERNEGPFKDAFITFHEQPSLEFVKGSLSERYNQMSRSRWGGSTNIESAFKLILKKAIEGKVPQEQMPTMMIMLSDMEFNVSQGYYAKPNPNLLDMVTQLFEEAGYKMPKLVFWNIASRSDDNKPVKHDEKGIGLVSGFSPSILKSVLSGKSVTPMDMMLETINSERYEAVTI